MKIRNKLIDVVLRIAHGLNNDNLCLLIKYAFALLDSQGEDGLGRKKVDNLGDT